MHWRAHQPILHSTIHLRYMEVAQSIVYAGHECWAQPECHPAVLQWKTVQWWWPGLSLCASTATLSRQACALVI